MHQTHYQYERAAGRNRDWPLVLRLAGLWLIWSAWASAAGWILSAMGRLNGTGYGLLMPVLIGCGFLWWCQSRSLASGVRCRLAWRHRYARSWLALGFCLVAGLSLAAALLYIPWSFDAVTYRLPRSLDWLAAGRWYWIGTLDGRLDYSSCGLEWQSIPLLLLTHSDRALFLLSYLPFLMLPGLIYLGGRTLGVARRPLLIWMWLLPCANCVALQCSGIQSDGYCVFFTVACLAFAGVAIRRRDSIACAFTGLAASLLTGAKLSNLPLLLPLGVLFLVAAWRSNFFKRPAVLSLAVMALASFLPLAVLSYRHTGTWTGDPTDQWGFRTGNPVAAAMANLIIAGTDLARPPVMVGTDTVNAAIKRAESHISPFLAWLKQSHRSFVGIGFGDMVYEGDAGAGFPIGCFLAGGTVIGCWLTRRTRQRPVAWWQNAVVAGGVVAWVALLMELGSGHSARNAAPFLPLLLLAFSRVRPFHRFLLSRAAPPLACVSMASVILVIILTPARPLLPLGVLRMCRSVSPIAGTVSAILDKYELWENLRDDLKPMREHLPPGEAVIGYACAFRDTSYGLCKPLGSRVLREIGVPRDEPSRQPPIPDYVVATDQGIQQRYGISLDAWMQREHKQIRYSFMRSTGLSSKDRGALYEWCLVGPATATAQPAH